VFKGLTVFGCPNLQGLVTRKISFLRAYRGIHPSLWHCVTFCNMLMLSHYPQPKEMHSEVIGTHLTVSS